MILPAFLAPGMIPLFTKGKELEVILQISPEDANEDKTVVLPMELLAPRAGQLAALVHFVTNLATKVAGKT